MTNGYSPRDPERTELPDIYAAQDQAIRTSGEILRDMGAGFWSGTVWVLEVTDENGQILFVPCFSTEERLDSAPP